MAERAGVLVRLGRKGARILRKPFQVRVRIPMEWARWTVAHLVHWTTRARLAVDRWVATGLGRRTPRRVMATACWGFPIYSQTFVYQELSHLMEQGFDLRFVYSHREPRELLPEPFAALWRVKRRLLLNRHTAATDFRYYQRRRPDKVEALVRLLGDSAGMSREQLMAQPHFMRAFSFARMVEAWAPRYLHSYFFYEGSLFTLVAAYLLDIPRGVSCYADHLLEDYDLKVVPLHLQLCAVVIATSEKIKQELMTLAPGLDADRILVKPNAISAQRFPPTVRREPAAGEPFRLVCVGRIDPKKGMVYLVEALRTLRDRNVNVECHFIGSPDADSPASLEYHRVLQQRIAELGVVDCAHLAGRRTQAELRRMLERAHVFVAPYVELRNGDKDGIPTTLLEAMATGLPVVATDAGSMCEVISPNEDGIIVPQRDAEALAGAVADLLERPGQRARLGERAVHKIHTEFDVTVCEHRFHDRVLDLLGSRP